MVSSQITSPISKPVSSSITETTGGFIKGVSAFLTDCSLSTLSQALFQARTADINGTTVKDWSSNRYHATLKDSHCLTLVSSDTITIDKLPSGTTITSNDGSAALSISGEVITCDTGGTVYGLLLSNGSYFPCSEGNGTRLFDNVRHYDGVISDSTPDWTATQDDLAFNANNSFGVRSESWGELQGPVVWSPVDSSGGRIELDFTHRNNTNANQFIFGSTTGGRFDMSINTSGQLSFVFKTTPYIFGGGIQLTEFESYNVRLEWTANDCQMWLNGVEQTKNGSWSNGGGFPTEFFLGNRKNLTTDRFRGWLQRFDYYDSTGQLQRSEAHETGIKIPLKGPARKLLVCGFGQSRLLGSGVLTESTYVPTSSYFSPDGRRLLAGTDPMYPDDGGAGTGTILGSVWPAFLSNVSSCIFISTAVSASPVVQIGADTGHWGVGGDHLGRFKTRLTEAIGQLKQIGYQLQVFVIVGNGGNETSRLPDGATNHIESGEYTTAQIAAMEEVRAQFGDIQFGFYLNGQQDPALSPYGTDINDVYVPAIIAEQEAIINSTTVDANGDVIGSYCHLFDDTGKTSYDNGYLIDLVHLGQEGNHVVGENLARSLNALLATNPDIGLLTSESFYHQAGSGHHNFESVIDFNASAPTQADYSYGDLRSCPSPKTTTSGVHSEKWFFSGTAGSGVFWFPLISLLLGAVYG